MRDGVVQEEFRDELLKSPKSKSKINTKSTSGAELYFIVVVTAVPDSDKLYTAVQ